MAEGYLARNGIGLLKLLCALLLFHSFAALLISGDKPLTYLHQFRQTQTALTAYWILEEGFRLAYQTPVVGSPWSIPFEFPVYQALVAGVAELGVPLKFAGRTVSWVFFIACLWPIRTLQRCFGLSNWWFWACAAMFLAAPIHVFWGRSFMIETTALFFALAHLASFVAGFVQDRMSYLVVSGLCATVAILAKTTTLPAFSLLAGLFFLLHVRPQILSRFRYVQPGDWIFGLAALFLPYTVGLAWVGYTDMVKVLNAVGRLLTSEELTAWNYGTLQMRLSSELWAQVLPLRILPDILGRLAAFIFIVALLLQVFPAFQARLSRKQAVLTGFAVLGFFTPLALFTNLHMVHNYYQVANAVFLIFAVALLLTAVYDTRSKTVATALVAFVVVSQIATFHGLYYKGMETPPRTDPYLAALSAREQIPKDAGLYVFGTDWSSVVPFHAERKSFTPPSWMAPADVARLIEDPETTLGGLPLGGIIYCTQPPLPYGDMVKDFVADRAELASHGTCTLYAGDDDGT